jgi:hypothetical protein
MPCDFACSFGVFAAAVVLPLPVALLSTFTKTFAATGLLQDTNGQRYEKSANRPMNIIWFRHTNKKGVFQKAGICVWV